MGGPGKGCSGCWNPQSHAFDKNKWTESTEMEAWLQSLPADELSGIVLSGGDPVQHYISTIELCNWVKSNRPKWTIGMFTGYSYKEVVNGQWKYLDEHAIQQGILRFIKGSKEEWYTLESLIDYSIMGRYNKLLTINAPLVTTSNQELKLFSNKYTESSFAPQQIEMTISDNGDITLTGFPVGSDFSELNNEK
jgi:organic radical activating enzyme